jgi:hypothetical protein
MEFRALPFTAYPSPWKTLLVLIVCLGFVAAGVFLVPERSAMFYASIGLFALGAVVMIVQLLPGSSYLTVSREGFETCTLFRKTLTRWQDVSEFGVYRMRGSKFVGFNFSPEYSKAAGARKVSRGLVGFEGALPDTYGFRAEDLAELLDYCRSRWEPSS